MFEFSLAAFFASFVLIALAEMGDKTQFLALSFAAKHNVYKVILGVFLAIIANFAITVSHRSIPNNYRTHRHHFFS